MNSVFVGDFMEPFHAISRFLASHKNALSAIETICKVIALGIGAWWTWKGFVRNRLRFPSATLDHVITCWSEAGKTFLHVKVRITNTGNVLIKLSRGKTWIEKLTPLPSKLRAAVSGGAPFQGGKHELNWSLIAKHGLSESDHIQIEPKEIDELNFDFVIDPKISRVLVYTHLENEAKGLRKKIGWNLTSIYDIPETNPWNTHTSQSKEERRSFLALIRKIFLLCLLLIR